MSHRVLFVCTGNYYRSRFAELYFNAFASGQGVPWVAVSRGIDLQSGTKNVGPIAAVVLERLETRGILIDEHVRTPMQLQESDLSKADLVIALNAAEHRTMMSDRFPPWADRINYWNIPDLPFMKLEEAFCRIEDNVAGLVEQLRDSPITSKFDDSDAPSHIHP